MGRVVPGAGCCAFAFRMCIVPEVACAWYHIFRARTRIITSGLLFSLLDDDEKPIQRRVDYLRVVPTYANPGRSGRVEGESDPAGHASHVLLIEPAADDHIGIEFIHHPAQ